MRSFRPARILIGAMSLLLALSACGGTNAGGNGSQPPTPTDTRSNLALLEEAVNNMRELQAYTLNADIPAPPIGLDYRYAVKTAFGAQKCYRTDIEAYGTKYKLVVLGVSRVISVDDGKTWISPSRDHIAHLLGLSDIPAQVWYDLPVEELDAAEIWIKNSSPPTEQIGDVETRHMILDLEQFPGLSPAASALAGDFTVTEGTIDVWVDTGSPAYVRKMKIEGKSGKDPIQATLEWSNFGPAYDIQLPYAKNRISP